ncbi:DUF6602 domain-containing protein [Rubellimicrobium arenae]|uniref:DUF6602 domain-containing protein n=1 Tax=Rubellimicrobium arenae TaxID=2817372 RepID=UPI001B3109B2|nr:DUF6602 domain-containing protein [Rubellimicrobium arenae]
MANLEEIFEARSNILRAQLLAIRSAFHHAGLKGTSVEQAVADVLREILPDNIGITSGIAIDSQRNTSRQLDIILYDKARTPMLFSIGGQSLVPIECVFFVIEVKTKLTKAEYDSCVQSCKSVKELCRTAYYPVIGPVESSLNLFGRAYQTWQTIYLVIALEAQNIRMVAEWQAKHREGPEPITGQIDSIFCLDAGLVCNAEMRPPVTVAVDLLPSDVHVVARISDEPLRKFLVLFSRYYNQARMGLNLDLTKYINLGTTIAVIGGTERQNRLIAQAHRSGFDLSTVAEPNGGFSFDIE